MATVLTSDSEHRRGKLSHSLGKKRGRGVQAQ